MRESLLTGNEDVDVDIMSLLYLDDLRNISQTNRYALQLSKQNKIINNLKIIQHKIEHIINTLNHIRIYLTINGNLQFSIFTNIMNNLEIDYDDYNKYETYGIFLTRHPFYIKLSFIRFHPQTGERIDSYFIDYNIVYNEKERYFSFLSSKSQLKEFLLQCYYNNFILII